MSFEGDQPSLEPSSGRMSMPRLAWQAAESGPAFRFETIVLYRLLPALACCIRSTSRIETCLFLLSLCCIWLSTMAADNANVIQVGLNGVAWISSVTLFAIIVSKVLHWSRTSGGSPAKITATCHSCTWLRLSYGDIEHLASSQQSGKSLVAVVETINLGELSDENNVDTTCISSVLPSVNLPSGVPPGFASAVKSEPPTTCPCCLTDFGALDEVILTHCGHVFCAVCLPSWVASLHSGGRCPVCRSSLQYEEV